MALKAVSQMPCAKCYVPGTQGVPKPGAVFQAHINCEPPPGPKRQAEPITVSPAPNGTLPSAPKPVTQSTTPKSATLSVPGLDRFGNPMHPGVLGMPAYQRQLEADRTKKEREENRKALAERYRPAGQERQGTIALGATSTPNQRREVPFHPSQRIPPRPAPQRPVPPAFPAQWSPQPTYASVARIAPPNQINPQPARPQPPAFAPQEREIQETPPLYWQNPPWNTLPRLPTFIPPHASERVAAWVEKNTTFYSAEQEAEVLTDTVAVCEEQERILREVREDGDRVDEYMRRTWKGRPGVFKGEDAANFRAMREEGRGLEGDESESEKESEGGNGNGGWMGRGRGDVRGGRGGGRGPQLGPNVVYEGEDAAGLRVLRETGEGNRNTEADAAGAGIETLEVGDSVSQRVRNTNEGGNLSGSGRGRGRGRGRVNARGGRGGPRGGVGDARGGMGNARGGRGGRGNGRGGRGRGNGRGGRGRGAQGGAAPAA